MLKKGKGKMLPSLFDKYTFLAQTKLTEINIFVKILPMLKMYGIFPDIFIEGEK